MSRSLPRPETRTLAGRLLFYEAVKNSRAEKIPPLLSVSEKLRGSLMALVGIVSFHSLLSRALSLAKKDAPGLSAVQIGPDGSLEGLKDVDQDQAGAGAMLIAQLLELLVTFIGENVTMKIVAHAWPDLSATHTLEEERQ